MSYIEIDEGKCKACGLCIEVCPKGLIKRSEVPRETGDYPVVFRDKNGECLACAMCAVRCPDAAIVKVVKS